MPSILLHSCCVPCSAHVINELIKKYDVTLFYFNPNIFPEGEYQKRLQELRKYLQKIKLDLIQGKYDHQAWLEKIKGYENEPERGRRCEICYRVRLEKTALEAKKLGFDIFCSTLSISPHKDAQMINKIGQELSKEYNVPYLASDWKKQNGFKKSCDISREEGFYRQSYCGCEFSIRER